MLNVSFVESLLLKVSFIVRGALNLEANTTQTRKKKALPYQKNKDIWHTITEECDAWYV